MPFYWEDISTPFPDIGAAKLTRLSFEKTFVFADAEAAADFKGSKSRFIAMNNRDRLYLLPLNVSLYRATCFAKFCIQPMKNLGWNSYDFHETYTIPGYEDFLLACKDKDDVPRWLSARAYAGCSLLCCTIPYRIMFALVSWEIPKYKYAQTSTPRNHGAFSLFVLPLIS